MSKVFINEETLTAIGDAIREKNGSADLIAPGSMADTIRNLSSGGGDGIDYLELILLGEYAPTTWTYKNDKITNYSSGQGGKKNPFSSTRITEIDFPNVSQISAGGAFQNCYELKKVNLPKLLSIHGAYAFSYCALEELNLPSFQLTTGGYRTCEENHSLKFVQLPSCYEINKWFFRNCYELTALVLAKPTVVNLTDILAFENVNAINNNTVFVYVPDELLEEYKVATNWATIADCIAPISSYPGEAGGYPALISAPEEV